MNTEMGKQVRWVTVEFVVFLAFALLSQESPKILATIGVSVLMAIAAYIYGSVAVGLLFRRLGEEDTIRRALTVYSVNYLATLAAVGTAQLFFNWLSITLSTAIIISLVVQVALIVQGVILMGDEPEE
jgi:amino acid transporter